MSKGNKTPAQIKAAQRKAGFGRRGPRKEGGGTVSDAGYVMPESGWTGSRNYERNVEIVKTVSRAKSDEARQRAMQRMADKHGIANKTVAHVVRYFRADAQARTNGGKKRAGAGGKKRASSGR